MSGEQNILDVLKPKSKPRLIDLVAKTGIDVSDWGDFKGGQEKASTNPKYCYEWSLEQGEKILLNIWFENMIAEEGIILQRLNLRMHASNQSGVRKMRAGRFDRAVRRAFNTGADLRVIILDRKTLGEGSATGRMLDAAPWTVTRYNDATGSFEILRGRKVSGGKNQFDAELEEFNEGQARARFVIHRRREFALRQKKIDDHKQKNEGRLNCEVPGCGFDFEARYGLLGKDYAQVHHLIPLSNLPPEGGSTRLDDLAVVCANCHVMIHRGGECRDLDGIIPGAN